MMKNMHSFKPLDKNKLNSLKGAGPIELLETIADTALRVSSLTGVFLVAVKNGVKDALK
jgi:hypothetical protein